MFAIPGILAAAVVIAIIEIPALRKKKLKKELGVFVLLLLFGTVLSIAQGLQANIPNPMDALHMIYQPLINLVFDFFK